MMDLYPTLLETKVLNRQDTRRIAQALHVRARQSSKTADIFPFIQQVATDIRRGALEPHPYAFVHLLGIYKDCKRFDEGHELWQWLVQQEEPYVSQAAYGAAIELMAYGGLSTLPELEELYTEGLKRFPGTFAEYHLSPDAIVPDRSQPVLIAGIPTILLQGILTARILARDWKKSYLALDTILRLYPTQTPSRFFELFMTERPISEAYTAFMVACRAGTSLNPGQVTSLITKLRAAMGTTASMADRMMLLRAVANALYAYQEAGGQLESLHVGVFIHCFEHVIPEPTPGEDYQGEAALLRNTIVLTAHEILSGLLQAGFSPQIHPFEALVSLAGKLRVPDLLTTTLKDIENAQIELGPIGTRSALTSAGLVKNKQVIQELWSRIISTAESVGAQIAFEDWITFTKACRRADLADYFREQLSKLSHTTTSSTEEHLIYQIGLAEQSTDLPFDYMTPDELTEGMETLKRQMKEVEAVVMSGSPLDLRTSPFYMHLDPATTSMSSLDNLRAVYDELTTDPHQPSPPPPAEGSTNKPAASSTRIPLAELRFMNWLTIAEMMADAETYESQLQLAMNQAIRQGKPFKGYSPVFLRKSKTNPIESKHDLRNRIRNLRNSNAAAPQPSFRKIGSLAPDEKFKRMSQNSDSGKWEAMKIKKHHVAEPQVQEHSEHPEEPKHGSADYQEIEPKLRYYVALKSDHDAPAKLLEQRRIKLDMSSAEDQTPSVDEGSGEKAP
jgi:hypothetical protein